MSILTEQYDRMLVAVRHAAAAAGRDPESVRLLAVSKTFPAEDIAELYRHGCRVFGENRVPELESKAALLPADIEWHLIGQLQSNKARRAVKVASMIHSVDSVALIERLDRIAGEENRHPAFLLEVNVSGEASKSGLSPDDVPEVARAAAAAKHLDWRGFMTVAPAEASAGELSTIFDALKCMRNRFEAEFSCSLPELSMGMSGDYDIAIRNGATLVRIGTAIFGNRNYAGNGG